MTPQQPIFGLADFFLLFIFYFINFHSYFYYFFLFMSLIFWFCMQKLTSFILDFPSFLA